MNPITTLGLIAAAFTAFSFLPQVIKCWKTKRTKDISFQAYLMIGTGGFLWLVYGVLIHDIPVVAANLIVCSFVATILLLKLKYG